MFLQLLEHVQSPRGERATKIYLPIDQSNIAKYVGLSLAAVSRGRAFPTKRGFLMGFWQYRIVKHIGLFVPFGMFSEQ
jgi:hypothetical protein